MKTELEIAEEHIESYKAFQFVQREQEVFKEYKGHCNQHKASCQRFLKFLEAKMKQLNEEYDIIIDFLLDRISEEVKERDIEEFEKLKIGEKKELRLENKITDLKNAIKLYDENGI